MSRKWGDRVLEVFLETFYNTGTFQRPDGSGIRGQGVGRKSYQDGGDEFPYDNEDPVKWGEPWAYSRDSAGHGGSHAGPPVPKSDDDFSRWLGRDEEEPDDSSPIDGNIMKDPGRKSKFGLDDDEMKEHINLVPGPKRNKCLDCGGRGESYGETCLLCGGSGYTCADCDGPVDYDDNCSCTVEPDGDEKMREAMGVPFNVKKGGEGTGGMHTGGRVMPGSSGDWSSRPRGDQWDNQVSDEELSNSTIEEFMSGLPVKPRIGNKVDPSRDQADAELNDPPDVGDVDDERPDFSDPFVAFQFKFGGNGMGKNIGHSMKYHRMQPGFTWKESFHVNLVNRFMMSETRMAGGLYLYEDALSKLENEMKLTVNELKEVVKQVVRNVKAKGVAGYESDEDEHPKGWKKLKMDIMKPREGGGLYKRQGSSNMGPYTSEGAIRAIVRSVVKEEFKTLPKDKDQKIGNEPETQEDTPWDEAELEKKKEFIPEVRRSFVETYSAPKKSPSPLVRAMFGEKLNKEIFDRRRKK